MTYKVELCDIIQNILKIHPKEVATLKNIFIYFQMTMVATQMVLNIGMMAGMNVSPGTGGPHIPGLQVQPTMIPIITITQGKMGSYETTQKSPSFIGYQTT